MVVVVGCSTEFCNEIPCFGETSSQILKEPIPKDLQQTMTILKTNLFQRITNINTNAKLLTTQEQPYAWAVIFGKVKPYL